MLARALLRGYAGEPVPPTALVALYNGSKDGNLYAIGAASSSDAGETWTRYGSNPVLAVGTAGAWDDSTVKDPYLLWDGSQFVAYYSGFDGGTYRIGRATAAAYTGPWTKDAGNPVLDLGAGGAFDDAGLNFPVILYDPSDTGKEWKCWYGGNDGAKLRIGYAHSSDGVAWTKVGQVLDVGAGGTWNDEGMLPFGIVRRGSTYVLFVGGRQGTTNPRWQGGVYTFSDPEGTYTAGSNPTMLARFNDADTSKVLTSDTASGSAVVHIATTAAFTVGEAVLLIDTNSQSEAHYIASVDSGTQVTLDSVTSSAFTVANGATLRSFAYNSVTPRSAIRRAGGWYMFGTAFQGQEDLTPGGIKLREGSLRWTASALDGAWAYDYTPTGLLLPLFPAVASSVWDAFSAENPSVIAAP